MSFRKNIQQIVYRSWWVFLFMGTCLAIYSHAMHQKQVIYADLEKHLLDLQQQKESLSLMREDLLAQIQSQSDPAWIELMLMKGLGVVPEGQQKVYFHD